MKRIVPFFMFLLLVTVSFSQEKITNQSVLDMVDLGFGSEVIISKIESSDVDFDVSIDALKALKVKGVPSEVLALMIKKSKYENKTKGGVYYERNGELVRLEPTVFAGSKSNSLAFALTSGIVSAKQKSYLPGETSSHILPVDKIEFVFQFDVNADTNLKSGMENWWFKLASSPKEFALVKLKVKKRKKERELVTAKVNGFTGSQQGIDSKNAIIFKYEDMGGGKYKVVPEQRLEPGEYCFFYQGTIPQGGVNNQSVFDFTVE